MAAVLFSVTVAERHPHNAQLLLGSLFRAHIPPNRDFCLVQAYGELQYIHSMSSAVCISAGVRARSYCDATCTLLKNTIETNFKAM